jgi:hypothetical protein
VLSRHAAGRIGRIEQAHAELTTAIYRAMDMAF